MSDDESTDEPEAAPVDPSGRPSDDPPAGSPEAEAAAGDEPEAEAEPEAEE